MLSKNPFMFCSRSKVTPSDGNQPDPADGAVTRIRTVKVRAIGVHRIFTYLYLMYILANFHFYTNAFPLTIFLIYYKIKSIEIVS